ncbi:AmmeMemoRadiSam system protein A [Thermogymnomonas acidicola]|nr:AmmeMemoRadiSam system protein A [Thermogymnomonas acidicola]
MELEQAIMRPGVREALRKLAVEAIRGIFTGQVPEVPEDLIGLDERCGAFVTIKENGMLRGCIGFLRSDKSIPRAVMESARLSATEDPRFPPLTAREVDNIEVEITLLGEPFELDVSDGIRGKIRIGTHGLIVERGPYRGLLLPQVATEFGFDEEQFLEATCEKAGLPPGAWKKPGTRVYAFEGLVF